MIRPNRGTARKRTSRFAVTLAAGLALVLAGLAPAPAEASPETLRRAFQNIINGPLDMVMSPIVGGYTLAKNLQEIEDTAAVRAVYALPGYCWLTGLNFGSGGIRTITGILELLPGVILFPFETDVDPLFDPAVDAPAMVEWENQLSYTDNPWLWYNPLVTPFAINFRFGLNYTRAEF